MRARKGDAAERAPALVRRALDWSPADRDAHEAAAAALGPGPEGDAALRRALALAPWSLSSAIRSRSGSRHAARGGVGGRARGVDVPLPLSGLARLLDRRAAESRTPSSCCARSPTATRWRSVSPLSTPRSPRPSSAACAARATRPRRPAARRHPERPGAGPRSARALRGRRRSAARRGRARSRRRRLPGARRERLSAGARRRAAERRCWRRCCSIPSRAASTADWRSTSTPRAATSPAPRPCSRPASGTPSTCCRSIAA